MQPRSVHLFDAPKRTLKEVFAMNSIREDKRQKDVRCAVAAPLPLYD